jgi:hypothetical protein
MSKEHDRAGMGSAGPAHEPISLALPFHRESRREVHAAADMLFPYLDDHAQLSAHMGRSSWMMLGSRMAVELDTSKGRAVGAHIRLDGRVLGIPLSVEEVVIERQPPVRKVWQTLGVPRLLVIGDYRMGFEIQPRGTSVSLCVFIDYALPTEFPGSILGRLLGEFYARWCTASMAQDAANHFPSTEH